MAHAVAPPSAAAHPQFSLCDLLSSNLPTCARVTLYKRIALQGCSCIKNARLACRGLRQLIDEQIPGVCIKLDAFSPGDLVALGADGLWLQRRPTLSKVIVVATEAVAAECIALPFAGAPQEACRRVKELVFRTWLTEQRVSGAALFGLLHRLPALATLKLEDLCVLDGPAHTALAACALDGLPQLTSLTLGCSRLAGCIGPGLAARLTRFVLDAASASDGGPGQVAVARTLVPRLTAVRELKLVVNPGYPFEPSDLRVMLDTLSPSVQHFRVRYLALGGDGPDADVEAVARLAHGSLTSVEVRQIGYQLANVPYNDIAGLLATALLPSRVLGPRLPLLHLDLGVTVSIDLDPPDPDPAIQFLERCDEVRLSSIIWDGTAPPGAVFGVAQRLGPPRALFLQGALEGDVWLDQGEMAAASRLMRRPVMDPVSLGSLCAQPSWQAVPEVGRLALHRSGAGGANLVLSGPALQPLLGCDPALRAWVETVAQRARYQPAAAGDEGDPGHLVSGYQALPYGAGVLLVHCSSEAAAVSVAAAAQGTITLGCSGGERAQLHGLRRVLQSAWYACRGAGGGVAGSGSGGAGSSGGRAGRSRDEGRLLRLRWLLEVWEGLRQGAVRIEA